LVRGRGVVAAAGITCPEAGCGAALEHGDVRAGAAADDFEHYDRILARRALEATPDFRWCTRAAGPHINVSFELA